MVALVLNLLSCQKEELYVKEENNVADKTSTNLKFGFSTKRKTLMATEWTKRASLKPRYGHTSEVFQDKMWILWGRANDDITNDVLSSTNGAQWENEVGKVTFSPREHHASAVFKNQIWVIGGREYDPDDHDEWTGLPDHDHNLCDDYSELRDIWASDDGKNWQLVLENAPFAARSHHDLTVFEGALYLIGGVSMDEDGAICCGYSDAWRSYDGISWEIIDDFDALHSYQDSRIGVATTPFKNTLIAIGGSLGQNDRLLFSYDGSDWSTLEIDNTISKRTGHSLVSDNKTLWLAAGNLVSEPKNDIVYSTNGENWYEAELSQEFPKRSSHSSVFFNNQLWIINGYSSKDKSGLADIWSFGEPGCCEIDDIAFE